MIRLVAIDVDGTLLNSRHEVTRATAEAIDRVRRAGVDVVLATSRPPRALWPILERLDLVEPAVFIASQGALTGRYSADGRLRIIERHPMPVALAQQVAVAGATAGMSVNWYAAERWLVPHIDDRIRVEAAIVGCAPDVADLSAETDGPDKLLLLADALDITDVVTVPEGLVALASTRTHLEIARADVDKGEALRRVCALRGIAPGQVAAVGDGRNDLAMLAFAGMGVAPANAHPAVRASADLITASNDEDGVADALDRLVP
ncbi:MAG TPA: Cof-type HAD-IIB family hydrolase [Motilibacterales bacterium]|nr:Cof-type HAD-IIB family hydrolase [Motilibacterales bacterium]